MSRKGSYIGGSTIIDASKTLLGLYADRDRKEEIKVLRQFIKSALDGNCIKHIPYSISAKLKGKIKKAGSIEKWAKSHRKYKTIYDEIINRNYHPYLLSCIRSKIQDDVYPEPPFSPKLNKEIKIAGSIEKWMLRHPEYQRRKEELINKNTRNKIKKKPVKTMVKLSTKKEKKQAKLERDYLNRVILARLQGKKTPKDIPKYFCDKYPKDEDILLLLWLVSHHDYQAVFSKQEKKKKRIERLGKREIDNAQRLSDIKVLKSKDKFKDFMPSCKTSLVDVE